MVGVGSGSLVFPSSCKCNEAADVDGDVATIDGDGVVAKVPFELEVAFIVCVDVVVMSVTVVELGTMFTLGAEARSAVGSTVPPAKFE